MRATRYGVIRNVILYPFAYTVTLNDTDQLQFAIDELVNLGFVEESFDVTQYATNDYVPSN